MANYKEFAFTQNCCFGAMVVHVAVVGAGIIGCSVATWLLENLVNDVTVTIVSEKFTPETTASDKSGGLVIPPNLDSGESPEYTIRVKQWVCDTLKRLQTLYMSPECCEMGLSYSHGYCVHTESPPNPWWKNVVLGFHVANDQELAMFNTRGSSMSAFNTFIVNCRAYLPWLLREFRKKGGNVVKRKVSSLSDLSSFDVVINCSGLGASQLARDANLHSVKGYLVAVKAPWVKIFYDMPQVGRALRRAYIFPRTDDVVLGGVAEFDSSSEEVDPYEVQGILQRCQERLPSLCGAEVLEHWTGYRPVRDGGVRLERENGSIGPVIIHCYGHGGYGVTLHWGCAKEVGALVQEYVTKRLTTSLL